MRCCELRAALRQAGDAAMVFEDATTGDFVRPVAGTMSRLQQQRLLRWEVAATVVDGKPAAATGDAAAVTGNGG